MENKITGHSFYFSDGESSEVMIRNTSQDITWGDLTELYFNFLQAAGYQLTRKDFAELVQDSFL